MRAASPCFKGVDGGSSPPLANKSQFKRENATRTDRHREYFTVGFLAEPARPHFTWNLSRKAGVSSIRETEMSPDLGLVRTGPCSNFIVGKNT